MKEKYINYYMSVAKQTAALSTAEKLKVGAIIVKGNRIISFGYNGTPSGWDNVCEDKIYHDVDPIRYTRYVNDGYLEYLDKDYDGKLFVLKTKPEVLHAELNCIGHCCESGESTKGASLFVTTAPCLQCSLIISTTGITDVYYDKEYRSLDGVEFLTKRNINVIKVKDVNYEY